MGGEFSYRNWILRASKKFTLKTLISNGGGQYVVQFRLKYSAFDSFLLRGFVSDFAGENDYKF